MTANASLAAIPQPASFREPTFVVLVNGVPDPRLMVREIRRTGPLDRVTMRLSLSSAAAPPVDAEIIVAIPLRLADEEVRWIVLGRGAVTAEGRRRAAAGPGDAWVVQDGWTAALGRAFPAVWSEHADATVVDGRRDAELGVGGHANRSVQRHAIGGESVHVLRDGGARWTLREALATLFAFAGLEVSLRQIPCGLASLPLAKPVPIEGIVGEALDAVLREHGLLIRRDASFESGRVIERVAVTPASRGTAVRLGWSDATRPLTQVLRSETEAEIVVARQWFARANGVEVESTFALVGGWDPALEGGADALYERGDATFATYANAYRLWVLNEDGRFTEPPFSRGPAFDLGGFFGDPSVRPRPLRFLPCVTLDDTGRRREPIVEVSLDSGAAWTTYAGVARVLDRLAAVYLDDTVLPSAFLAAAKAGTARVRVTASLRSPLPLQASRWRGNPFRGVGEPRVFEHGDAFAARRVASTSIHYAAVQAGTLAADEVDQSRDLSTWLLERMNRDERTGADARTASVTLPGSWPLLKPGDRMVNAGGDGTGAAGASEFADARAAIVREVRLRVPDGGAPTTLLHLNY